VLLKVILRISETVLSLCCDHEETLPSRAWLGRSATSSGPYSPPSESLRLLSPTS
jgi:hypothetical protein